MHMASAPPNARDSAVETAVDHKQAPNAKKPRKPRNNITKNEKTDIPTYQAVGQSLSGFLLSAVNTKADVSTLLSNLGHRPPPSPVRCPVSARPPSDFSSSKSTLDFFPDDAGSKSTKKQAHNFDGCTYSLRDISAIETVEMLLLQYGQASHMGVRDPSYLFFINSSKTGALYYKILNKVAVITGDPLCCSTQYLELLDEFRAFCKAKHLGVAMLAVSDSMATIARGKGWTTMRFGEEKVVNPLTNPLILGTGGKRTVTKCKQLLKAGSTVQIYCPAYQNNPEVEAELVKVYDDWRADRNDTRGDAQAFMTVFDILALPRLMTFLYVRDGDRMHGFAALRKLGDGFHIDPFIATADAPKGTTDLLLFSAMAFCNTAGISKLSLGFEPNADLAESDISGMPEYMSKLTRKVHKRMWSSLPLEGKHAFYQRFYPDEEQDAGLHIIYFHTPGPRHVMAMIHFANISLRSVMARSFEKSRRKPEETPRPSEENEDRDRH